MILNGLVYRLLRVLGWRFHGGLPSDPKVIVIGAPHTSNWDFIVFMAAMRAYRIRPRYLGKHTLFRWPLGPLLVALGGIPVDRSRPGGVVAQVAEEYARSEELVLVVAPEGTRRWVPHWKTGFLHMAVAADVPVVPGVLDFAGKRVTLEPPVLFNGDAVAFMDRIRAVYASSSGLRPRRAGPIRLAEESS